MNYSATNMQYCYVLMVLRLVKWYIVNKLCKSLSNTMISFFSSISFLLFKTFPELELGIALLQI